MSSVVELYILVKRDLSCDAAAPLCCVKDLFTSLDSQEVACFLDQILENG